MKAKFTFVISSSDFIGFLQAVMAEKPVIGPRERADQPGYYLFGRLERAEDFVAEYGTTTIPPKKAFAALKEKLFTFTLDTPPVLNRHFETFPFVLLGVHPCDLAGIDALDHAYSQPPAEVRWAEGRKRATIIGLDCQPDSYCFCTSLGTESNRIPCDLFLTPIGDGYLVEVYSDAGKTLLEKAKTRKTGKEALAAAKRWRRQKMKSIVQKFDAPIEEIADILEAGGLTPVWKETAERCYSCGSCNTTCPTCFCFDMIDEMDADLQGGTRYRTWDSCQLLDFAVVAGDHNFRGERWQRVKHRWQRKFLYLYRRFGRPYCTGCGRCSRACTADINIVDVTNRLIALAAKEE